MKKNILFLVFFIFSMVLMGCENTNEKSISITNTNLSSEDRGLLVDVNVDFESLNIAKSDIVSYGVFFVKHEVSEATEITINNNDSFYETSEINVNKATLTIANMAQSDYSKTLSMRAYIKYLDKNNSEQYVLANSFMKVVLYDLAKSSTSEFAQEVVRFVDYNVSKVELTIDTENDTITSSSSKYQVNYVKEGTLFNVTITLNEGYFFDENINLLANDNEVNANDYTVNENTILYSFEDSTPSDSDFVPVSVTLDLNGGSWTSDIFSGFTPDNTLTAVKKNDSSGVNYTILDTTQAAYKDFYKIFIKYDLHLKAYKVVAVDAATSSILGLDLPDYDYVLAIFDFCKDTNALNVIKQYASSESSIGLYVMFDLDVAQYTSGDIKTMFYSSFNNNFEEELINPKTLPTPYRFEYNFLGWSDGTNTVTAFPGYTVKDNVTSVTYTAMWEPYTADDFQSLMMTLIPSQIVDDLYLPETYSEFAIIWHSNHPEIISNKGVFKKPYQATTVTLSASLISNSGTIIQNYDLDISGYKTLGTGIASSYIYRSYNSVSAEFFDTLDIINCAFVTAYSNGTLSGYSTLTNVNAFILSEAHAHGDYVTFSIDPGSQWSAIASSATAREAFADNIVKMINEYGFDGVDIDWEHPAQSEATNFTKMMQAIYTKVKANNPNHIVSAAIAGGMWQPPTYDLLNSAQYMDYINMMTYGMVSSAGYYQNALKPHTSYDNPENQVGRTQSSCSITESIDIFHNNYKVPYSKIIVGVAFYGMKQTRLAGQTSWSGGGSVFYTSIASNYLNNPSYTVYYDVVSEVPYILKNDGTEFISYDNPRSVIAKSNYAKANGLGGIMYWEDGCDRTGDLLAAMKTGLNK